MATKDYTVVGSPIEDELILVSAFCSNLEPKQLWQKKLKTIVEHVRKIEEENVELKKQLSTRPLEYFSKR